MRRMLISALISRTMIRRSDIFSVFYSSYWKELKNSLLRIPCISMFQLLFGSLSMDRELLRPLDRMKKDLECGSGVPQPLPLAL